MRSATVLPMLIALCAALCAAPCALAQGEEPRAPQAEPPNETIKARVGPLDLHRYKTTIRGLTRFGDRREGTDRNRQAIDWIEAQLKSYGCTNTERIHYTYTPPAPRGGRGRGDGAGRGGDGRGGRGGGRGNP